MHIFESRTKRKAPQRDTSFFKKAKHSEEWHHTIDAIVGVLQPSDPKFPYPQLRSTTDEYLKKKGKITQSDIDIRLALLIDSHRSRDIAVAATAHAMSAGSLRAILHVNLNVSYGSYWGLEPWLKCLLAANNGNPASVTDLEVRWAQHMLPFATHGPMASGKILVGISRALRECATPNMNAVPDFLNLTSRAISDYGAQLEGLRLRNDWMGAYAASYWLAELGRTSPVSTPPGFLLPEHILDAQFPVWRTWARWRPDMRLLQTLSSIDGDRTALLTDLLALEGPDFLSGGKATLREGLIEQYQSGCSYIKLGRMLIQVPGRTKDGLREILESAISTLGSIWTAAMPLDRDPLLRIFGEITVSRPMSQEAVNLVQALLFMSSSMPTISGSHFTHTVLQIYTHRNELGGCQIRELQDLMQIFDHDHTSGLRRILLTSKLIEGIANCVRDSQAAICALMKVGEPWSELALELHTFCTTIKESRNVPVVGQKIVEQICLLLPTTEQITMAISIYDTARRINQTPVCGFASTVPQTNKAQQSEIPINEVNGAGSRRKQPSILLNPVEEVVEQYISCRLLSQPAANHTSQRTFDALLRIWEVDPALDTNKARRVLAILVADATGDSLQLRIRCLNGIASTNKRLGPGLPVQGLLNVLENVKSSLECKIVELIRLLAKCSLVDDLAAQLLCWRDFVHHLLLKATRLGVSRGVDLTEYTLNAMDASEWLTFLSNVQSVFATGPSLSAEDTIVPSILRPGRQQHREKLFHYTKTITRLEKSLGQGSEAVRSILDGDGDDSESILAILHTLQSVEHDPTEPFLHKMVGLLSSHSRNAREVSSCVQSMSEAVPETVEHCKKIWDAVHGFLNIPAIPKGCQQLASGTGKINRDKSSASTAASTSTYIPTNPAAVRYDVPISVVEVMVTGLLLDERANNDTKYAVRSVASLLNVAQYGKPFLKDKLVEVAAFWQTLEAEILQEATRLEALRKALKIKDPKGTSLLLQQHSIPDTTELDDEILKLPAGIRDMVERIGDHEVEFTFPLSVFTQLQRCAMGIPENATTLMLQLFLGGTMNSASAFCLHYNNVQDLETIAHTRYRCSTDSNNPTIQICTTAQTALTWQLGRIIYSKLMKGEHSIADLYQHGITWLPKLAQLCVSCSAEHSSYDIHFRRAIPCDIGHCARLWYDLPLHVRIPEIRIDIFAVDVALFSVYAAATTGKTELLLGCPIRRPEAIKFILNVLPPMFVMRDAVDLSSVLKSYHPDAEQLISWAVVQHRGFVATATGLLKIPNLPPGTHQFVLANASPKLESTFTQKIQWTKREPTVLFHGTAMDRLPAILAQGLRVCSGTSLQRVGAAHGKGIYLSDDPATSFHYSTASLSWKNSGLNNMRMLLGCELLEGTQKVVGNMHVVTDPESVMVRYILLFTKDAKMPIRGHVEPAMASGMKALRSGTL